MKNISVLATVIFSFLLGMGLFFQSPAAYSMTREDLHAVQSFQLTEQFLSRYKAVQLAISKHPAQLGFTCITHHLTQRQRAHNTSLDEAVEKWTSRPGVAKMLLSKGISGRKFMLGLMALAFARIGYFEKQHPQLAKRIINEGFPFRGSKENIAFYAEHHNEIHQFMISTGRGMLQRNEKFRKCE